MSRMPPVAVIEAIADAASTEPTSAPSRVKTPWTMPTVRAENATPQPSEAAKATDANPSITDFRAS